MTDDVVTGDAVAGELTDPVAGEVVAGVPSEGAASDRPARTAAEVREAVREIIVELSPVRGVAVEASTTLIDGLGYNSLALVELAFTLEDEFDLAPIDEVTARRLGTLETVQRHVVAELAGRGELAAEG